MEWYNYLVVIEMIPLKKSPQTTKLNEMSLDVAHNVDEKSTKSEMQRAGSGTTMT